MAVSYVQAAVGLVVVYYVVTAVMAWYPLRKFKGPFLASFSYLWVFKTSSSGEAYKRHMALHDKYRSEKLIRIGPDLLITADADIIRRMSAARSPYGRSGWYESLTMDPPRHTMFSTADTVYHDELKTKTAAGYSGRDVPTLEADIDEQILKLKTLLRDKYASTKKQAKAVDFAPTAQYFTLDAITKIAFGREFGHLTTDSDVISYMSSVEAAGPSFLLCADVPAIGKIILSPIMLKFFAPKQTDPNGLGLLMGVAKSIVSKRFSPGAPDQNDMLGSSIRNGLNEHECVANALIQVLAGSDTTATNIRTTMLYLATSPSAYCRLQAEIDEAAASGAISSPITYAEAKKLPYLQAVLLEGFRIHPPLFVFLSKKVPPGGDTIDGKFIPGGTQIAQNIWSLLKDKELFGEDSHVFRPERWLEASPEKRSEMEKVAELIFGYGRWMCAGKTVALMELNKLFVELLRDFDFQFVNPTQPWRVVQWNLFQIHDMIMHITLRNETAAEKSA